MKLGKLKQIKPSILKNWNYLFVYTCFKSFEQICELAVRHNKIRNVPFFQHIKY